jgi:hypothetical protein
MPIVFTPHTKFQLRKRHLSQKLIKDIVKNPKEIMASFRNRRLRRKLHNGKILQVVTVTEGPRITVISGYYLRKQP